MPFKLNPAWKPYTQSLLALLFSQLLISYFTYNTQSNWFSIKRCLHLTLIYHKSLHPYLNVSPAAGKLCRMSGGLLQRFPVVFTSSSHFIRHCIHIVGETTSRMPHYWHPIYHRVDLNPLKQFLVWKRTTDFIFDLHCAVSNRI